MYELILLITLPDEYAWTLRIVRIIFDNNGASNAPYQLPGAEAINAPEVYDHLHDTKSMIPC